MVGEYSNTNKTKNIALLNIRQMISFQKYKGDTLIGISFINIIL
jgi:hypothetical protein